MRQIVAKLALELKIVGLINMQFALTNDEIYLLEVNPRASRTTPFVAKATGLPVAQIGAQIMIGKSLDELLPEELLAQLNTTHYAIKEVVLPFRRFPEATTLLGPEMKSTGEVMGISQGFAQAFTKAYLAGDQHLPKKHSRRHDPVRARRHGESWALARTRALVAATGLCDCAACATRN